MKVASDLHLMSQWWEQRHIYWLIDLLCLLVFRLQDGSILQGWPLQVHLLPWRPEGGEGVTIRLLWHQGTTTLISHGSTRGHLGFVKSNAFWLSSEFLRVLCCSSSRWQISSWLGTSVRRRWTGRRHRTDSRRSFGINSAASATRVCRSSTTSPSSRWSPFSSSREAFVCLREWDGGRRLQTEASWMMRVKGTIRMSFIFTAAESLQSRPTDMLSS